MQASNRATPDWCNHRACLIIWFAAASTLANSLLHMAPPRITICCGGIDVHICIETRSTLSHQPCNQASRNLFVCAIQASVPNTHRAHTDLSGATASSSSRSCNLCGHAAFMGGLVHQVLPEFLCLPRLYLWPTLRAKTVFQREVWRVQCVSINGGDVAFLCELHVGSAWLVCKSVLTDGSWARVVCG